MSDVKVDTAEERERKKRAIEAVLGVSLRELAEFIREAEEFDPYALSEMAGEANADCERMRRQAIKGCERRADERFNAFVFRSGLEFHRQDDGAVGVCGVCGATATWLALGSDRRWMCEECISAAADVTAIEGAPIDDRIPF